ICLLLDQPAHLAPPRLIDPLDHRQGQILLVLELVIEGAARVPRLPRHIFEHQVAVAIAGEAPRGRLEQRAPRAGAPLSLGCTRGRPSRSWRIHELAPDFQLEDVWALPTPGGPDDFPRLVRLAASLDPSQSSSGAVRALFAIRWKIGQVLGWDGPDTGLGPRVPTLRDRLPPDLRDAPSGPDFDALPFTPL